MPTGDYILKDKKLPSVTTIIGRFKNAIGLIIWSNQLGLKGLNYFDELKKAGDTGTSLHDLAELHIKGEDYELPEDPTVLHCFNQFLEWWNNLTCEVIWTEKKYISKKLNVGGCPDLLVKKDGKYILVDFKTSKAIYSDMIIQLSCYAELIRENDGIEIDRAVIVRFPKDDDNTEIRKFSKEELAVGLKQFKLLRKAFDIDKDLNKLLKGRKK
jgi:hypothetical protein